MKLRVFLTSSQVLVHVPDELPRPGIFAWLRQGHGQEDPLSVRPANALTSIDVEDGRWLDALTQALSLSRSLHTPSRRHTEAEVELGLSHCRVAIMSIDQSDGILSVPTAKRDLYVHRWAEQTLHVAAQEQIIRWRALPDPHHVLVSCISRSIAEDVARACVTAGVRLMSCRPALLSCIPAAGQSAPAQSSDSTVVWTEFAVASMRYSAVQLLRFQNRRLAASWRGWVPPAGDLTADETLDAAAARFAAHHGVSPGELYVKMRWPSHAFTRGGA